MIYIDKETKLRVNIYYTYKGFSLLDTQEIRDRAGVIEIAEPAPPEDYSPDTYYRTEQDAAPYVIYTKKSDEQIAELNLVKAKQVRAQEVSEIIVTTQAGNTFDGHEDAQNRMNRAVNILTDTDLVPWVLADNTIVNVSKAELLEALRLSGTAQSALWAKPYLPPN